jgi:hypothetical protein
LQGRRQIKSVLIPLASQKPDSLFLVCRIGGLIVGTNAAASDKVYTQKGEKTSTHKLSCSGRRVGVEILVKDGATNDHG